ncbi:hypothetical protein GCM10023116_20810 [Kistimonas scapharcae]|uniref:Uncharacterized protein n=1 Tax=Kistimonas scapharcae TaxID=1036133 RepID=A0ABP8V141_9GAMM
MHKTIKMKKSSSDGELVKTNVSINSYNADTNYLHLYFEFSCCLYASWIPTLELCGKIVTV